MSKLPRYTNEERHRIIEGFQCPECFGCRIGGDERQPHVDLHYLCLECGCRWDRLYFRPMRPELPKRPPAPSVRR